MPEDLPRVLRRCPGPELRALVDRYGRFFTLRELRQLLLNPFVDGEILTELASVRTLTRSPAAKAAIAAHARTPEAISTRFLPHLFWRHLLDISVNGKLRLSVRRVAERHLIERLPRLALGERIALARRASPAALGALLKTEEAGVLTAALDNPRAKEEVFMPLLRGAETSPQALALIAGHPRWRGRYEIRLALCRQPRTPFQHLQDLLPGLRRDDLKELLLIDDHSSLVHRWIRDLLHPPGDLGDVSAEPRATHDSDPGDTRP